VVCAFHLTFHIAFPTPSLPSINQTGYNECIEPYTSNLYARRVKAGEFIVVNPHLLQDLTARGLWTPPVRHALVAEGGSIQNIPGIPEDLKQIYRTVWEVKQKALIDMAADRGAYIDQSQSLNAFMAEPDYNRLTSMHFYGWKKGLKTGAGCLLVVWGRCRGRAAAAAYVYIGHVYRH